VAANKYLVDAARRMITSDMSCAIGRDAHNSVAGAILSATYKVPRWIAEEAVCAAVARGFRTCTGARVTANQLEYLQYVSRNPGCCIADVDRACRRDTLAGHKWVYDSVRRLRRRGLLVAVPGTGNRVTLHLPTAPG